jgi:hypothetical protein
MNIKNVFILREAVDDLNEGRSFYELQGPGVGDHFWNCMIEDIESLLIYAGIHKKKFGFFQMFAKRFPYAVYYDVLENFAYVAAVLPMRRDPAWISKQLRKRG